MRLKHIKLAGFKSFVDPTKVPFEQQMTAVVGPNGCGKSNIIDAVRWVLGESSAKNLRGDAMTDVIFNGAASRKPVGQASVELVFDNSSGRIQGNMADRTEVSIRRVVNRESNNSYFLNGTKCRRRDITDIFLGTGLGPRSYAIIEQGTISRLIESKPQELRVFIEEAAGISKYKERRRDTENRIRHTRENLDRLADVRAELALQIDKLHQQSEAAKRFKTLKASERSYKAQLIALRWQQFNEKYQFHHQKFEQSQCQLEGVIVNQNKLENSLFKVKQKIEIQSDRINELQQDKIKLTQKITVAEQSIKHAKHQQSTVQQELSNKLVQLTQAQQELIIEQEKELSFEKTLEKQLPDVSLIHEQLNETKVAFEQSMQEQNALQSHWDKFHLKQSHDIEQRTRLDSSIVNLKTSQGQIKSNLQQLQKQLEALNNVASDKELSSSQQVISTTENLLDEWLFQQQEVQENIAAEQVKLSEYQQKLANKLGLQQAINNQLTQLNKREQTKPDWLAAQSTWLDQQSIEALGHLHQNIIVEKQWQSAAEMVLSHWLQAEIVNMIPKEVAIDTAFLIQDISPKETEKSGTLSCKIKGGDAFIPLLNQIYLAEDIKEATELLTSLKPHESVICQDTTWVGHGFLRKGAPEQNESLLKRAQDVQDFEQQLKDIELWCEDFQHKQLLQEERLNEVKLAHNELTKNVANERINLQQQQQSHALLLQKTEYSEKQRIQIQNEIKDQKSKLETIKENLTKALKETNQLKSEQSDGNDLAHLNIKREQLQDKNHTLQNKLNTLHENKLQAGVRLEQTKNQLSHSKDRVNKTKEQISLLEEKIKRLNEQLLTQSTPFEKEEKQLQLWLSQMTQLDDKLSLIHQSQSKGQQEIKNIELEKQQVLDKIEQLKETISQHHLDGESNKLRAETCIEQLKEAQQQLSEVITTMPPDAKETIWQAHLIRISKDISRLGPINLAAIDEYNNQFERKTFLDQQNEDLTQAISTLESAIAKIDKESRHKFKITFDEVNRDLKTLFPKVFGGGNAYLELTGEDLLDTGVSIMARPPGKKNSTIHLLSGGEKALTALSLVFAIFRLNPAPFCMLDEVDAPLDDANVGRFCNLVREMSQTVQFIYISHNKIAMEMASHLTGVTMFEPGVSRMVAVDIDEAVAMAEVS